MVKCDDFRESFPLPQWKKMSYPFFSPNFLMLTPLNWANCFYLFKVKCTKVHDGPYKTCMTCLSKPLQTGQRITFLYYIEHNMLILKFYFCYFTEMVETAFNRSKIIIQQKSAGLGYSKYTSSHDHWFLKHNLKKEVPF